MSIKSWKPTDSTSFWINRVSRALTRAQDEALKPFGFSMGQLAVLHALERGEALTPTELARRAGVELPTMTQVINRMERDEIVARTPHAHDRRSALVCLTPVAASRFPAAKKALIAVEESATADLDGDERKLLQALLKQVSNSLSGGE